MPAIDAREIRKSFGHRIALSHVTLAVEPGDVLALFGPNGAGKTTLLKILAGLARPTSGEVKVLGANPREASVRAAIGVLGHAGWLHDALSAEENLAFYAKLYGLAGAAARERIDRVLAEVGLADRRADRVATFSRGMRQRLSIARAVVHDPKIVLLDEPFTGLDRVAALKLVDFLRRITGKERAVIAVTHELDAGFELATRVAILAQGKILLDRSAAGLDRASFESMYLQAVDPTAAARPREAASS